MYMASASPSRKPEPDSGNVGYYDDYSDPEADMEPVPNPASNGRPPNEDEDDEDEEDEDEDFVTRPRRDSSPAPIPYQPAHALKRKASPQQQPPPPASRPIAANGGAATSAEPPPAKRARPEPLEPSILCAEPLDEFVMEIADWVYRMAQGRSNIEVEAKVGLLLDTRSNERVNLPVLNETILAPDYPEIRFSSDMTLQQHASYNQSLNKLVERTSQSGYPHARIRYEHTRVVDTFYTPPSRSGFGSGAGKVRVTTDEKTGKVKDCVQKTRIADLNVYSPKRKLDWRVSVSTETPVNLPTGGTPVNVRRKDRLSYAHQSFKIDLTQVTPSASAASTHAPDQLLHELEIEFADANELMALAKARGPRPSGASWSGKDSEAFDELIRVFVNNIRILVRNAG